MPLTFSSFVLRINDALVKENGNDLAFLLRPTSPHGKDLIKEIKKPTRRSMTRYEGCMSPPWDEIAIQYVLVCDHVARERCGEAFKEQSSLVSLFFRFFSENKGWTLPALFSILRDLRDLAFDADLQAKRSGQKSECMEESARIIAKAFGLCINDRMSPPDQSRKWGVYYIVGLIMKCYFRVRRISLSKNILRGLKAANDLPALSEYPRSHQVTYRYYIGMLGFLNEDFPTAEQELTLAFYNCHIESRRNQERILAYLIPLRILRGHLPSQILLRRFPALDALFRPFISAIRLGDLQAFDAALDQSEKRLLDLNLWLTLEKAREHCVRGFCRRVWVAEGKTTRIPLSSFHAAFKLAGIDQPMDETECIIANQIYKGFIRGYLSHEKQMLVLAGTNAFPRFVDRQNPLQNL